jgi:hypothetical protein
MPARNIIILIYVAALAAVSASRGFMFFVDSRTYFSGGQYVPFLTEMLYFYPISAGALSLFNLISVYLIATRRRDLLAICILSPYNVLLVSNVTKEALIFFGFILFFVISRHYQLGSRMARVLRLASLAVLIVRPIYALLYLVGNRRSGIFFLIIVVILVWYPHWAYDVLYSATELLDDRAYVTHTGRDFFNYLCVLEKRNVSEFISCVLPVLFMIPIHEDTLTLRYIPYLLLHLPLWIVIYRLAIGRRSDYFVLLCVILSLYVYIFAVSPTFGAFIRYFHPVVWFAGFYLICGLRFGQLPITQRKRKNKLLNKINEKSYYE